MFQEITTQEKALLYKYLALYSCHHQGGVRSEYLRKFSISFKGRGIKRALLSTVEKDTKTILYCSHKDLKRGNKTMCGSPELTDEITGQTQIPISLLTQQERVGKFFPLGLASLGMSSFITDCYTQRSPATIFYGNDEFVWGISQHQHIRTFDTCNKTCLIFQLSQLSH